MRGNCLQSTTNSFVVQEMHVDAVSVIIAGSLRQSSKGITGLSQVLIQRELKGQ